MKKIIGLSLCAIGALALTACSSTSSSSYTARYADDIDDSIKTTYKLADVLGGNTINTPDTTAKEYYTMKVATNASDTIFLRTISLDELLAKGKKDYTITISSPSFTEVTETEYKAIYKELYTEDKGLYEIDKNVTALDFMLDDSSYLKSYTVTEGAINAAKNNVSNINLVIAYLPVYSFHFYESSNVLRDYIMVPVYYSVCVVDGTSIKEVVDAKNDAGYTLEDSKLASYSSNVVNMVFEGSVLASKATATE